MFLLWAILIYHHPFIVSHDLMFTMKIAHTVKCMDLSWHCLHTGWWHQCFPAGFSCLNLLWPFEWCVVYLFEQLGLLLFICGYEAKLIKLERLRVPAAQTSGLTVIMFCNLHIGRLCPLSDRLFGFVWGLWIKAKHKKLAAR